MKKRAVVAFLAGCMLVVLGGLWFSLPPSDPVYQGKPLSDWLRNEGDPSYTNEQAETAVRALGTKAIPWLLWAAENGRVHDRFAEPGLMKKIESWLTATTGLRLGTPSSPTTNTYDEQGRARWALFLIGQNDKRVIRFAKRDLKTMHRGLNAHFLAQAGNEHWEYLLRVSEEGSVVERCNTVGALAITADDAPGANRSDRKERAILVILKAMRDANLELRDAAALAYANIPECPIWQKFHAQAVPLLIELLSNTNSNRRSTAVYALESIGTDASPAIPELIAAMEDRESYLQPQIALALGKIDKEKQRSKPALLKLADPSSPEMEWRTAAATTLWEFGIKTGVIDELIAKLESPDASVREGAAKHLLTIGPAALEAMTKLLKALPDPDLGTDTFMPLIRCFEGLDRGVAIPYLIQALSDADPMVRKWAAVIVQCQLADEANPELEAALTKATRDAHEGVRSAAENALRRLREAR